MSVRAMALVTLEEAKVWLRVDGDAEDGLITTLIEAAEKYLEDATGRKWTAETATAKMCALALIAEFYENRSWMGQVTEQIRVRPAILSMIQQLTYAAEPEGGGGDAS